MGAGGGAGAGPGPQPSVFQWTVLGRPLLHLAVQSGVLFAVALALEVSAGDGAPWAALGASVSAALRRLSRSPLPRPGHFFLLRCLPWDCCRPPHHPPCWNAALHQSSCAHAGHAWSGRCVQDWGGCAGAIKQGSDGGAKVACKVTWRWDRYGPPVATAAIWARQPPQEAPPLTRCSWHPAAPQSPGAIDIFRSSSTCYQIGSA